MQRIEKLVVTNPDILWGVILINKKLTIVNSKNKMVMVDSSASYDISLSHEVIDKSQTPN